MHVAIMDEAHGTLVSPESMKTEGRLMVVVRFEEDLSRFPYCAGDYWQRGDPWMNYIFSDGH